MEDSEDQSVEGRENTQHTLMEGRRKPPVSSVITGMRSLDGGRAVKDSQGTSLSVVLLVLLRHDDRKILHIANIV